MRRKTLFWPASEFRKALVRRGFSLFEIVLALAIFGVAMAMLTNIISNGATAAIESRDLARAQMFAESKMAEVLLNPAGPQALTDAQLESTDTLRQWTYTVFTEQAPIVGMLVVRVTVKAGTDSDQELPVQFALTRWIIDPALDLQGLEDEAAALAEEEAAAEEEAT